MTVVVPYQGCAESFDDTLASVLQHRPGDCEVVVTHDGGYQDPYALHDEVRFIVADSDDWMDQLRAGAKAARGRFVHILSDGCRATENWIHAALGVFEDGDIAFASPVVCCPRDRHPIHTGWASGVGTACEPKRMTTSYAGDRIAGVFLDASFWRRDVLRTTLRSFGGTDALEGSLVVSQTITSAGGKMGIAEDSRVLSGVSESQLYQRTHANQRHTQALIDHFHGGGWVASLIRGMNSVFTGHLNVAFQRATAPLAYRWADQVIAAVETPQTDCPATTLDAKTRLHAAKTTVRRAA
ncbi:MAG: glycosyltransferase [Planctomycetota bacterium]